MRLCSLHMEDGDEAQAVSVLREGIRNCPDDVQLRSRLVAILTRAGRLDEAAEQFYENLPYDLDARRVYHRQMDALRRDHIAATDGLLRNLLAREPEAGQVFPTARLAASVYLFRGQIAQAVAYVDDLLSRYPDEAGLFALAGELCFKSGDVELGIRRYEEAIGKDANAEWMAALADGLRHMGDRTAARKWLDRAIHAEPSGVAGHWGMARLFRDENNQEASEASYARAVLLDAANETLADEAAEAHRAFHPDRPPEPTIHVRLEKDGWIRTAARRAHNSAVRHRVERMTVGRRTLALDIVEVTKRYEGREESVTRDGQTARDSDVPPPVRSVLRSGEPFDLGMNENIFIEALEPARLASLRVGRQWSRNMDVSVPWRDDALQATVTYTVEEKNENGLVIEYSGRAELRLAPEDGLVEVTVWGTDRYDRFGSMRGFRKEMECRQIVDDPQSPLWHARDMTRLDVQ